MFDTSDGFQRRTSLPVTHSLTHSLGCTRVEHILCEFRLEEEREGGGALHSIGDAPPSLAARPTDDQPIILSQLPLFSDSIFVQNSFESSAYSHKTRQQRETESKFSNVPIVSHDVSTAFHIAIIFVFAFYPIFPDGATH